MLDENMLENLYHTICQNIHWISQHSQQHGNFTSKKNDQLLQNFVNELICYAELKLCSDIHIEPQENFIRIRLRLDGVLSEQFQLPKFIFEQLCCKIKILANMNIAQTRLPQDGKFIFDGKNSLKTHIRISTCPTIHGEKIVLRLLNDNKTALDLDTLGMSTQQLILFKQVILNPYGLILITGPTGSGKTSTLYATLNQINATTKNVITLEDPVEVSLPGINQIHVKNELSFAVLLRAILRQDPDIIMIGEIRDEETARIAIQAANTGHLVFATLHTNNCIETINRLIHMKTDKNDLIACLRLIMSQRLLRKKCLSCSNANQKICSCSDGYAGRVGVFEMLNFNEELKQYLLKNTYCLEKDLIQYHQLIPIHQKALDYAKTGVTTHEEIKRVFNINDDKAVR